MSFISLIEIIKKNVNPEIKVLLFISDPKDLGELRLLARKAEKLLLENKSNSVLRTRQVNEISINTIPDESDQELDPQVEAIQFSRRSTNFDYSKIKCWNCLSFGHSYIYCPEETRHIFCYKCGERGVVTTKCKNSHLGNRKRSEMATGDSRSQTLTPSS